MIVAGTAGGIVYPPGVSIVVELITEPREILGGPPIWLPAMRASGRHCHGLHMHSVRGGGGAGGAPTRMRTRPGGC